MITRRHASAAIAVLLARPATGWAQTAAAVRRVAWFGLGPLEVSSPYLETLRGELRDLGWIEGRNLAIGRFTSTRPPEDFEAIVREILVSKPEVVVTQEFTTLAMLRSNVTLPVVFGFSGDPVQANLVQSLARPGTNYTGMSYLASALVGKRIEFLRDALPHVRRIAILARPQHPGEHRERAASEEAAQKLGISVAYFPIREIAEIDKAFDTIRQERCDAVVIFPDYTMFVNRAACSSITDQTCAISTVTWRDTSIGSCAVPSRKISPLSCHGRSS
jgi:putative ABC transport system substrate-binding protein